MAHVEELRQIHADINAMETVIKQAEESKRGAHESARRIVDDYRPLKHEVDLMRTELLGLEKLPELANEEKERLSTIGILEKPKSILDGPAGWPASMYAAMQHHQHICALLFRLFCTGSIWIALITRVFKLTNLANIIT